MHTTVCKLYAKMCMHTDVCKLLAKMCMHTDVCKLHANKVTHTLVSILYANSIHIVCIRYAIISFRLYVIAFSLHADRMQFLITICFVKLRKK